MNGKLPMLGFSLTQDDIPASICFSDNAIRKHMEEEENRIQNIPAEETEYCFETSKYEPKNKLVEYNNTKRLIRDGVANIGYFCFARNGKKYLATIKKDTKEIISSYAFDSDTSTEDAAKTIFDGAIPINSDAYIKRNALPFKLVLKHESLSIGQFSNQFKPNTYVAMGFYPQRDTAMDSLTSIIGKVDKQILISAQTYTRLFAKAYRLIRNLRIRHKSFPFVSVYAMWTNFNPGTELIKSYNFETGTPIMLSYSVIDSRKAARCTVAL